MRFGKEHYEKAITDLEDGKTQLEPNGNGCHICGDSGHQAWECGSNPLLAQALCNAIADKANKLHDQLHKLCKCDQVDDHSDPEFPQSVHCEVCEGNLSDIHNFLHWLAGHETYMGESQGPSKMRTL